MVDVANYVRGTADLLSWEERFLLSRFTMSRNFFGSEIGNLSAEARCSACSEAILHVNDASITDPSRGLFSSFSISHVTVAVLDPILFVLRAHMLREFPPASPRQQTNR